MTSLTDVRDYWNNVFRDNETEGVESTPLNQVDKAEARLLGSLLYAFLSTLAFSSSTGFKHYASKSALDADLSPAADSGALVLGDGTAANDGFYRKVGGTGTGSWSQTYSWPTLVAFLATDAKAQAELAEGYAGTAEAAARQAAESITNLESSVDIVLELTDYLSQTGSSLLGAETDGFAIDGTSEVPSAAVEVKDEATPANDYTGSVADWLSTFFPAPKIITLPDGSLRWSPHNRLTYPNDFSNAAWTKTNATLAGQSDGSTRVTASSTTCSVRHSILTVGTVDFYRMNEILVREGTADWIYLNPGDGGINAYTYFDIGNVAVGTQPAGYTGAIYTPATNPNSEITIPDGYVLCCVHYKATSPNAYFTFGLADGDGSTAVTPGKYADFQKAQTHHGVKPLKYVGGTSAAKYDTPYDWSKGERTICVEPNHSVTSRHGSDFTQSNWSKTNVNAALDAIGPAGEPCSTLTAAADGGSVYQAVTSAAGMFSAYVRRKTGAGTIKYSVDGGSTLVDITSSLSTTEWTRIYKVTAANPSFGFEFGTSGDEIEVDYAHFLAIPTLLTPFPVYGANTSRAADAFDLSSSEFTFAAPVAIYMDFYRGETEPHSTGHVPVAIRNTAYSQYVRLNYNTVSKYYYLQANDGSVVQSNLYTPSLSERIECTIRVKDNDIGISVNGEPPLFLTATNAPSSLDKLTFISGGTQKFIRRIVVANKELSDEELRTWKWSGVTGDVGLRASAVVAKHAAVANTGKNREPCVHVLWERGTKAGIAVFWMQKHDTGHHPEAPGRLVQRNYMYDDATETFTATTDQVVIYEPSGWASGLGHSQSSTIFRVNHGPYKGRLVYLFAVLNSASGTFSDDDRDTYVMVNDKNGDPNEWSIPVKVVDSSEVTGSYALPPGNGGIVEFPQDHATYPGRVVTALTIQGGMVPLYTDNYGGADGSEWTLGTEFVNPVGVGTDETNMALSVNGQTIVATHRVTTAPTTDRRVWSTSVDGVTFTEQGIISSPDWIGSAANASLLQMDPDGDFGPDGRYLMTRPEARTGIVRAGIRMDYSKGTPLSFEDGYYPVDMNRYFGYTNVRRLLSNKLLVGVEGGLTPGFNNDNTIYILAVRPPWDGFGGSDQTRRQAVA